MADRVGVSVTKRTCSIDGCEGRPITRGWCAKHYSRWKRHGDPLRTLHCPDGTPLEDRLRFVGWLTVQRREGIEPCWEWRGGINPYGYGRVHDGTRMAMAHRVAYALWVGPLRDDELVCHRCDNRLCVRPDHLFTGQHADNSQDMVSKGRSTNGERHFNAKLTDEQVAAIRRQYASGALQREIAAAFGISRPHVSAIVNHVYRARPTNPEPTLT